jgi:hypothetical protein
VKRTRKDLGSNRSHSHETGVVASRAPKGLWLPLRPVIKAILSCVSPKGHKGARRVRPRLPIPRSTPPALHLSQTPSRRRFPLQFQLCERIATRPEWPVRIVPLRLHPLTGPRAAFFFELFFTNNIYITCSRFVAFDNFKIFKTGIF